MTVADVLRTKGSTVFQIQLDTTLADAVRELADKGVGALVVVDDSGQVRGLISERDIVRAGAQHFDQLGERKVSDVMTKKVVIGFVEDSLDYVMALMTDRRIRHLPIMNHGRLVGVVSIGDVVKAKAQQAEVEIRYLTDYILGRYPG